MTLVLMKLPMPSGSMYPYSIYFTVNPQKSKTGLRTIRDGIPYTSLLRIEAIGFPTCELFYCSFEVVLI